jgi:hypothetical protein
MRLRKAVPVKGREGDEPSAGSNWEKVKILRLSLQGGQSQNDPEDRTIVHSLLNSMRLSALIVAADGVLE